MGEKPGIKALGEETACPAAAYEASGSSLTAPARPTTTKPDSRPCRRSSGRFCTYDIRVRSVHVIPTGSLASDAAAGRVPPRQRPLPTACRDLDRAGDS